MLDDSMNFRVVTKFFGQMLTLTAGPLAMGNRVEGRSPVMTRGAVDVSGSISSIKVLMITCKLSDTFQMVGYDRSRAIGSLLKWKFAVTQ